MTEFLEKMFDRVYSEKDFSINIAIFVSGIAGVTCYLILRDYVLTLFSFVIIFPVVKIIAGGLYLRIITRKGEAVAEKRLATLYNSLTGREKEVVMHFVTHGGSVMTWGQMNRLDDPEPGVESLARRGLLNTSVTMDGMRETFELDLTLFNYAYKYHPIRRRCLLQKNKKFLIFMMEILNRMDASHPVYSKDVRFTVYTPCKRMNRNLFLHISNNVIN